MFLKPLLQKYFKINQKMFLKNEIVYLEGATEDKIYVIYSGMFKIQKMDKHYDIDVNTNRVEHGKTVLYLIREDISGIEVCKGQPYRFTLQVNN
jgi:CRP-like cAMP-binding protein